RFFCYLIPLTPTSTLFPYTTLFRSLRRMDDSIALFTEARQLGRKTTEKFAEVVDHPSDLGVLYRANLFLVSGMELVEQTMKNIRSEEHTSELQSPDHLVCRLLLEKK